MEPPTAALLIKALEPYHPWFYEEVVQPLNVDVMAELAKKTHIPLATGERIFTKWGFREMFGFGAQRCWMQEPAVFNAACSSGPVQDRPPSTTKSGVQLSVGTLVPSYSMGRAAMYLAKRVGGWGTTATRQFWNGRDHSTKR